MANEVYVTVHDCYWCASNRRTTKRQRKRLLFSASGRLQRVTTDILELFLTTKTGNQFIMVVTNGFSKLPKAIPTSNAAAKTAANIIANDWVASFGITSKCLTDNGPQFTTSFFHAIREELRVRPSTTTEYHSQANGQVGRFNATIVPRLRHYVAEHQQD